MELKPVSGKTKFLLFRKLKDATSKAAAKLALQTEHEWSFERDQEQVKTKDGSIVASGGMEVSLTISAISSYDEVNEMLFESVVNDEELEVWEVDIAKPVSGQDGKYHGRYARGRLSSWTLPSSVDSLEELETEMAISGKPVEGEVTLTQAQRLLIEKAYEFVDTTVVMPG